MSRLRRRAARAPTLLPLLAVALTVSSCRGGLPLSARSDAGSGSNAAPVVAADGVLCDLTRRLAAEALPVRCLLDAGQDPHGFRLEPSQKALLGSARLVLVSGYGLTPALESQPGTVAVSELAVPDSPLLGPGDGQDDSHGDSDDHGHGHGHAHGGRDPHVWHNPRQAAAMVALIADRLAALDPPSAAPIRRRAAAMEQVLGDLDGWNRAQFAAVPAPPPPLASGHRAFASLARAYGLRELPLVDGGSSSDVLRPEAFRTLIEQLRRERVPRLFPEQLPAPRSLQRISDLSGVPMAPTPLTADGLAVAEGGPLSLVATLTGNTCTIVTGWGGRCDEAGAATLENRWEAI